MILAINLTSNISLVSGDSGGTGKFLGIDFQKDDVLGSDCTVTATKLKSGQSFLFNATDTSLNPDANSFNKVGAGTVMLQATPGEAWNFLGFSVKGDELKGADNTALYKPVKYGIVVAEFERKETVTIEVTVVSDDLADYVVTMIDNTLHEINSASAVYSIENVLVGTSPYFEFVPNSENHVSIFEVTNTFMESASGYTFELISVDQELTVYFSPDGEAFIPAAASDVPISLGDGVSLTGEVSEGGSVTQARIVLGGDPDEPSLLLWDIVVGENVFTGTTTVELPSKGIDVLSVYTSDDKFALLCDVNNDGKVTKEDANAVAIALATNGREYDEMYDVNMDGALDSADIQFVHDYIGIFLEELDFTISPDGNIIYIATGHFSFFRCR